MSSSEFLVGASTLGKIGSPARGIRRLRICHDGMISVGEAMPVGENPTYLAWVGGGRFGVVHEVESGSLSIWVSGAAGIGRVAGPQPTNAPSPCHLSLSADGSAIYVANYRGRSISVHEVSTARRLCSTAFEGSGPHEIRQSMSHPHQVVLDTRRQRVLVPDLGGDRVRLLRVGHGGGVKLEYDASTDIVIHRGAGPRHLVVAGDLAIVANELDRSIGVLDLEFAKELGWVALPGKARKSNRVGASAIRATRAGTVLVADRGVDGVHAYQLDYPNRTVEHRALVRTGGRHPRDIELTNDERFLLVADQASDSIAVLELDDDGLPLAVVATVHMEAPTCLLRVPQEEGLSRPLGA